MDKETCNHCGRGSSVIVNKLTSIKDELVFIRKLLEKKPRKRSNVFILQLGPVGIGSGRHCNLSMLRRPKVMLIFVTFKLFLANSSHVYNDDGPSSILPDQVDDVSCKTLPSEVVDSTVDSEDRAPDGRIIDVLAQIHGEDDVEEFGDAAQNGYETANKEVV
ncbi:hypothetical protein K7X08_006374 [Anisodus acutangulus]|uniref:Uncharacterized protein n=1 Tax=Anisodus acutangulus TaxID=402998 RepID=A0A9Q1MVN5_9SOLA|nr:hypothetical protein K7X08_006374 [Anisodus acutangulus]